MMISIYLFCLNYSLQTIYLYWWWILLFRKIYTWKN